MAKIAKRLGLPMLATMFLVYWEHDGMGFTPSLDDVREYFEWDRRAEFERAWQGVEEEDEGAAA